MHGFLNVDDLNGHAPEHEGFSPRRGAEELRAVSGMGIAFLPRFLVAEDLASRRLELVLPENATFEATLHGVYPSRKYLSAKVRAFLDFIAGDSRFV